MRFVTSTPNEYLVVGRRGAITNRGTAASAFLWPGSTYVVIPSTKQEARFEMTQESKDGVPLRFKGIVIYRVTEPAAAARLFDFTGGSGHAQIQTLIADMCLGELRAVVSRMSLDECIEQRKTTLTNAVASALRQVIEGQDSAGGVPQQGWGIDLDVVQVAQVFIVDDELRRQLEAEVRNEIKARSDVSNIRTQEEIKLAQIGSDRRLQQESLEIEREKISVARGKLRLQKDLERESIEVDAPVRLLKIERQSEALGRELDMRRLANAVRELEVQGEMIHERAKHDLRKELLPIEQVPEVAAALSGLFRGSSLSIYGDGAQILSAIAPIVDLLAGRLRAAIWPDAADLAG